MQSGISASEELKTAFNTLVSEPSQRALLATIQSETLVPGDTLPSSTDSFTEDLEQLQSHLSPTQATYILLKTHPDQSDGFAAITFVPNAAPVRQKMLFASTRLTLVRELGIERFRQTIFATEKEELTAAGWARHEASEKVDAPLTEEESALRGVQEAEAREAQGTGARRGHVSSRVDVKTGEGVIEALSVLKEEGCRGTLVQLKYILPDETLQLDSSMDNVSPEAVAGAIESKEPRYTFYSHPEGGEGGEARVLFVYTCPSGSKIKERMVYSTGKSWTRIVAERDAELTIAKSLEATEPDEITADMLGGSGGASAAKDGEDGGRATPSGGGGFARPKRPGRR